MAPTTRPLVLHRDARGHSAQLWLPADGDFRLDYWSRSKRNVLRGLHYSVNGQHQLLTVISGRIFDVTVDMATAQWSANELSDGMQLCIPKGHAHGFYVLSRSADLLYKISHPYDAASERGVIWNDPKLAIPWPAANPILSDRDGALPRYEVHRIHPHL